MTKKSFKRDINYLARNKPKRKVLAEYACYLQEEHSKLKKTSKAKAKKKQEVASESDSESSDSDASMHAMEVDEDSDNQNPGDTPEADEEQTYIDKIAKLGTIMEDE